MGGIRHLWVSSSDRFLEKPSLLLLMPMVMDHISIYSVLDTDADHGVLISPYSDPKNPGLLLCPLYL